MKRQPLVFVSMLLLIMLVGCQARQRRAFEAGDQTPNPNTPANNVPDQNKVPDAFPGVVVDDDPEVEEEKATSAKINVQIDEKKIVDDAAKEKLEKEKLEKEKLEKEKLEKEKLEKEKKDDKVNLDWDGKSNKGNSKWKLVPVNT